MPGSVDIKVNQKLRSDTIDLHTHTHTLTRARTVGAQGNEPLAWPVRRGTPAETFWLCLERRHRLVDKAGDNSSEKEHVQGPGKPYGIFLEQQRVQ